MRLTIGINGGGIGGLAAAIALRAAGHDVEIYEQASSFQRVGADINLTPNAVRALGGLGVVEALHETAARPTHRISRMWDTGEETSRLEMADEAERQYGAPQLTIHRADLLNSLRIQLPPEVIKLGCRTEMRQWAVPEVDRRSGWWRGPRRASMRSSAPTASIR